MASLLAQLPGPINLRLVLSDLKFADILHDLVTAKGNRSSVPRALAVDRNETRELAGTLHIEGTNKDDAIAQIRAINELVTVGTTLTLQSTGATGAVTLNVLPSRGVSQPLDELFELDGGPVLAGCSFSFICEPYAYGPLEIPLNGPITIAPCVLDLGSIKGDYPTPLNMTFDMGAHYIHCLYVGRLKSGSAPTIDNLLIDLEGATEWGSGAPGVSGVLADAHDNRAEYNVSTWPTTRRIFDGVDDGTYLILNRGRMENAADQGTVEIALAGTTLTQSILGDLFYIGDLGTVHLPNQSAAVPSFLYSMRSSSGEAAHAVYADYIGFVPTSWGFFRWHPIGEPPSTACAQLTVSEHGMFVDGVANASYWRGGVINAVGPTKLALFGEPHNTALTAGSLAFYTTVSYRPRYNLWR